MPVGSFDGGSALDILELAQQRGIRLTPAVEQVAAGFRGSDQPMDVEMIWSRVNARRSIARSTVYRCLRELHAKGLVRVEATLGARTLFQVDRQVSRINLVDVDAGTVRPIEASLLAQRIKALVVAEGYDLSGGIDLKVRRRA